MKKNGNKKKGFTLIELIVVIAILVALMLILVPKLTGFTDSATKTANQANARAIYTALQASETAEKTGLYKSEDRVDVAGKGVQICTKSDSAGDKDVISYSQFWGDPKNADMIGKCKYDGTKVVYGTKNPGTYPAE